VKRLFAALVLLLAPLHLAGQQAPGFGTYSYDGAGNVTAAGNDTFVYDEYGRIRKASLLQGSTAHTQEFTYDRYGNIRTITTSGESNPAVPAVDEATNRINLPGPTTNMVGTYDASGNLTRYSGVDEFRYDALDVMTESTVGGRRRVYLYTANNERIAILEVAGSTVVGSQWTLRDASAKVLRRLSRDAAGAWRWDEDYIYRGSQLLAAEVPENTLHFHSDHLGTPRVITGNGGGRISAHTYYPFGRELTSPMQDGERMKFTGHERDATNLDYMHARSYLPWTGRFLSVDPVLDMKKAMQNPQGWNRYSYVLNNPIGNVDPDGREVIGLHGGFVGSPSGTIPLASFLGRLYGTSFAVPKLDYTGATNSNPDAGVRLASSFQHTAGTPRVLAGHSTGGDAAAIAAGASGPAGGGKWNAVIVLAARVENIMNNIEGLAKNGREVVIANIPGDSFGGDRSYEGVVKAITAKYGSMEAFRKQHPNVSIQNTGDQSHGGAAERKQTRDAVIRGLQEAQ
jgi:RHS repeat-associated protein